MAQSFETGLMVFGREKNDMQTLFAPTWPWAHTTSIHYSIKGALALSSSTPPPPLETPDCER